MVVQFFDDRLPPRFWDKVMPEPNSGCWIWLACINRDGYGHFRWGGRGMPGAHRVAYRVLVSEIPDGLVLDHLCRTRCCVNPAHLEPVTDAENFRRGTPAAWKQLETTHCPAGHPYDDANTYRNAGRRHCRECERAKCRRYHAANRAKENDRSRRYYATRRGERA